MVSISIDVLIIFDVSINIFTGDVISGNDTYRGASVKQLYSSKEGVYHCVIGNKVCIVK